MRYQNIVSGRFLVRENRFVAKVEVDGVVETVHVKNTGRCKELLLPGVTVYLQPSQNPLRKTKYDLVTVEKLRKNKPPLTVNMDSQAANDIAAEWLKKGLLFSPSAEILREVTYGESRFDFFIQDGPRKAFLEVKGVTLENGGFASFPDAPTERGVKHVEELSAAVSAGYEAYVLFVVQMKEIVSLSPNDRTHKAFGDALRAAAAAGVKVLAVDCTVTPDTVVADREIPVIL